MKTGTKKLLVVVGVTTLLLTVTGPIASFVKYNGNAADSAYASALLAQADEDTGTECDPSADDCGSIDDEESVVVDPEPVVNDTAAADKKAADDKAAQEEAAKKAAAEAEAQKKAQEEAAQKAAAEKAAANKAAADRAEAARRAAAQKAAQEEAAKKAAAEAASKESETKQPEVSTEETKTVEEAPPAPVITPEQLQAATTEVNTVLADTLAQTQYQEKADEKAALTAANQLGFEPSQNQVSQVQAALAQTNVNSLAGQLEIKVDFEKEVTATAAADIAAQLPADLQGEDRKTAINKIVVKAKRKVTDKILDQVAEEKYKIKITEISKEKKAEVGAKILLGVNPTAKETGGDFSLLEQVLFNVDDKDIQDLTAFFSDDLLASAVGGLNKKSFMGVMPNSKLSADGFTIPVACPKNSMITLTAKNTKGAYFTLGTKKCSENSKAVFSSDQPLKPGYYAFQVKPAKTQALLPGDLLASTVGQPEASGTSDPVLVKVVPSTNIPQPIVKAIENVDVAGLHNIQVTAGSDGKIHVSGTADISSIVVGTFESAVFTSAMLADAEGGMFEVVSSKPLPVGDHEITIYSTRPDERSQSSPVKLKFSLIQTANAASNEVVVDTGATRGAAETQGKFPVIPVAAGAGVVVAVVIGILLTRKKKAQ